MFFADGEVGGLYFVNNGYRMGEIERAEHTAQHPRTIRKCQGCDEYGPDLRVSAIFLMITLAGLFLFLILVNGSLPLGKVCSSYLNIKQNPDMIPTLGTDKLQKIT